MENGKNGVGKNGVGGKGKKGDGCGYLIMKKGGMEKERDSFDLAGEK